MQRIPRFLDDAEIRVLGALLEKEQTTPEVYPLSENALVQACNQKTARDPVMDLSEAGVHWALRQLFADGLVSRTEGARVARWRQNVDLRWDLDGGRKAIITLLLLRGPQTPGELRGRCERMHSFEATREIEDALSALSSSSEPLVIELPRAPGQKESRFAHLVQGAPAIARSGRAVNAYASIDREAGGLDFTSRIADLESRVRELEQRMPAPADLSPEPDLPLRDPSAR